MWSKKIDFFGQDKADAEEDVKNLIAPDKYYLFNTSCYYKVETDYDTSRYMMLYYILVVFLPISSYIADFFPKKQYRYNNYNIIKFYQ